MVVIDYNDLEQSVLFLCQGKTSWIIEEFITPWDDEDLRSIKKEFHGK